MGEAKCNNAALAHCFAWTSDGRQLQFGQLWQKQKVILIFLRHFACIACRAHAKQVWEERQKYEATGAKLIFIGNGQADFIQKFQEDLGMTQAVILTDPTLESFRAAGFRKGFFYVVHPKSALKAAKLALEGHRQTKYSQKAGNHWQLGGVLAMDTKGVVLYHFISECLGDFPEEPDFKTIRQDERLFEG